MLEQFAVRSANGDVLGVFFIPLQKENENSISSYLVAYKRNDTSFQYKSYSRSHIESVVPANDSLRKIGKNLLSIFGFFEKKINNVPSFVSPSYGINYKNIGLKLSEVDRDVSSSGRTMVVLPPCLRIFEAEVTIVYMDGTTDIGIYTIVIDDCPKSPFSSEDTGEWTGSNGEECFGVILVQVGDTWEISLGHRRRRHLLG